MKINFSRQQYELVVACSKHWFCFIYCESLDFSFLPGGTNDSDDTAVSSADIAEPIDLLFGLWTLVGRRKHKFHRIHQMVPIWCHARWRHLANMIEPFICGGDAALCQITLSIGADFSF